MAKKENEFIALSPELCIDISNRADAGARLCWRKCLRCFCSISSNRAASVASSLRNEGYRLCLNESALMGLSG